MLLEKEAESNKDRAEPNTHMLGMGSFLCFFQLQLTSNIIFISVMCKHSD